MLRIGTCKGFIRGSDAEEEQSGRKDIRFEEAPQAALKVEHSVP